MIPSSQANDIALVRLETVAGPFIAEIATSGRGADPARATVLGFGALYEGRLAASATLRTGALASQLSDRLRQAMVRTIDPAACARAARPRRRGDRRLSDLRGRRPRRNLRRRFGRTADRRGQRHGPGRRPGQLRLGLRRRPSGHRLYAGLGLCGVDCRHDRAVIERNGRTRGSDDERQHAHRNRQLRAARGPRRRLLGRADPALDREFPVRRARADAGRDRPRSWLRQAGGGAGQCARRQSRRQSGRGDPAGGGRGRGRRS